MNIAIIEYNAGNTQSVLFALERLGINPILTDDHTAITNADKVIFPGVGEAANTMQHLRNKGLDQLIPTLQQPVLGICLGMQLMCKYSEEGDTPCLGIFDQTVKKFIPNTYNGQQKAKVPHMGWNTLTELNAQWIDKATLNNAFAYFVHSYYVPINTYTIATTHYIHPFSAAMQKDNFYAVQFHPEKSAQTGITLLKSFIELWLP